MLDSEDPSHGIRDSNLSVVLQFEKEGHDFTGIAFRRDSKPQVENGRYNGIYN